MALDQQRNWTISMADNLEQVKRRGIQPLMRKQQIQKDASQQKVEKTAEPRRVWTTPPVYLPDEIIIQVLEFVARFQDSQETLASCCLLSRQWHQAAVPFLYARPWLTGKNFDAFYRAMCPTKNKHIQKSPFEGMVKILDMSKLVHSGSKSVTGRILSRTKENLEQFVAPQATFSMYSFPALSKCKQLHLLDLSLVSESPPLMDLFRTVSHLERLTTLRLPRSSGFSNAPFDPSAMQWPPNLESLSLSGGIDIHFLQGVVTFPVTLRNLVIEHCPAAKASAINHLLRTSVRTLPNLEHLRLANLPRLSYCSLDNVLAILPGLTKLGISVDYITGALFDLENPERVFNDPEPLPSSKPVVTRHEWITGRPCQLRKLELTNSGNPGVEDKITPIDVLIAVQDGTLPCLRQVRVAKSLFWQCEPNAAECDALADALKDSALEHGDLVEETGVWAFDG
ncbi:hypothetical protein AC579_6339 [Pseudocercospora musae]|uniref:F-box domain-containing protein n=1 Tax=Pseudocercospora musae TaxID=113226 RepID=A0A139I7S9_9PEZI|nr:hypothetical protein AC579_6339 [Pseudocercospora musae]